MGLAFLAPVFLAGLAALLVPILVHLTQREKSEVQPFPSLMFLRRIPVRATRQKRLRHLFLLVLRCLGLALLAAAFARPFFGWEGGVAAAVSGGRERVVLLDRSYSMGFGDRWRKALDAARNELDAAAPEDRVSLVFFAERAEAVTPSVSDRARLRATLDSARLGSGRTRYGPALKLAQERLDESKLQRREVVLITDFQKAGWDGQAEVRLPQGAVLRTVDVSEASPANVAVTAVNLQRDYASGRERVSVSARLTSTGASADVGIGLELDGRTVQNERVKLARNGAATVTFASFALPDKALRGTVRVAADALPADDSFHFVLAPGQAVAVLVVEGPRARPSQGLYLSRALAIGDRPRFRVETRRLPQIVPADLDGRAVVVLNETGFLPGAAGQRLQALVEKGGGLLVALGDETPPRGWLTEGAALLPAAIGPTTDREADHGARLAFLDYGNPVFEIFRGPRSGDFSGARFLRYRLLRMEGAEGVLARFDDGSVALAEKQFGQGRVLVWTSTLDTLWNDLPLQPVFLPFLHQLVKRAAGRTEVKPWLTVGEVLDLSQWMVGTTAESGRGPRVASPSGERIVLAAGDAGRLLELPEHGFYEINGVSSVAVNLDRAESDLSHIDPEELAAAVTRHGSGAAASALTAEVTPADREKGQATWWYLLLAALLVLGFETALSNRLSPVAT